MSVSQHLATVVCFLAVRCWGRSLGTAKEGSGNSAPTLVPRTDQHTQYANYRQPTLTTFDKPTHARLTPPTTVNTVSSICWFKKKPSPKGTRLTRSSNKDYPLNPSNHTSCLTSRSGIRALGPTARALASGTSHPQAHLYTRFQLNPPEGRICVP